MRHDSDFDDDDDDDYDGNNNDNDLAVLGHTSGQPQRHQNLPADIPSGLRSIYHRRKWVAPPILEHPKDKAKRLSSPAQKRKEAKRKRATHSSIHHIQRLASQKLDRKSSSTTLHLDSFKVDSVLSWSNPEGWSNWGDAPITHPVIMPKRSGTSKLTPQKALIDSRVQRWRLESVKNHVRLRQITSRIEKDLNLKESSTSPTHSTAKLLKSLTYSLKSLGKMIKESISLKDHFPAHTDIYMTHIFLSPVFLFSCFNLFFRLSNQRYEQI